MEKKILVILGMHRSGTSLISRWLKECGLNIGDHLVGADIGNEDGHFEDADFLKLHQELLTTHELPDTGLTDQSIVDFTDDDYKKICTTIEQKNNLHDQWGWKDPRSCMFLPYYKVVMPYAKYLIIVRDYNAVVDSL